MNNGRMGKFSLVCNRNVTKIYTAKSQQNYHPLKRILDPNSMAATARKPRSMTRSS